MNKSVTIKGRKTPAAFTSLFYALVRSS